MDLKFFGIFCGLALGIELLFMLPIIKLIKKIRSKIYNIDTTIIANKINEKSINYIDDKPGIINCATYEWIYKGKKRRLHVDDNSVGTPLLKNRIYMYWGGSYPETMKITINKRTGKLQEDQINV